MHPSLQELQNRCLKYTILSPEINCSLATFLLTCETHCPTQHWKAPYSTSSNVRLRHFCFIMLWMQPTTHDSKVTTVSWYKNMIIIIIIISIIVYYLHLLLRYFHYTTNQHYMLHLICYMGYFRTVCDSWAIVVYLGLWLTMVNCLLFFEEFWTFP